MWLRIEPVHAVVYFAPEHRAAQDQAGLAYFASRAAPLGAVPAEVVTALFYNFAPRMVARAIPDAWRFADPSRVLHARLDGVTRALTRLTSDTVDHRAVARAAAALRAVTHRAAVAGHPMFAANAALEWPEQPLAALWHATTLLREHRGDGHVAALQSHEVDGCQAHVLAAARGHTTADTLRRHRGFTDEEWEHARERLQQRGLLDRDGALTVDGRRLHDDIELLTDRLADATWKGLSDAQEHDLAQLLEPVLAAIRRSGVIPYPNPMVLPAPPSSERGGAAPANRP